MTELILSLLVWIGANSDYKVDYPQPIVDHAQARKQTLELYGKVRRQ